MTASTYKQTASPGGWKSKRFTWENIRRLPIPQLLVIATFVFVSLFGEWLAPFPVDEQNLRARYAPPNWLEGGKTHYLLGADHLGRDVLSRIIVGAQASFIVTMAALAKPGTVVLLCTPDGSPTQGAPHPAGIFCTDPP